MLHSYNDDRLETPSLCRLLREVGTTIVMLLADALGAPRELFQRLIEERPGMDERTGPMM
jgi:hypothetical protein